VCVAYGDGKKRGEQCTVLDDDTTVALDSCPTWVLPNASAVGYYHAGLDQAAFAALIGKGWKQLNEEEQDLVVNDGGAMIAHGDLPADALLDLIPLLMKGSRLEMGEATGMVGGAWNVVDDATRPALEAYVRKTFGPRARKLGWMPSPKDTIDSDAERGDLVSTDAFIGRDPKLLASATKLAKKWQGLPAAVRGQIVAAAVLASPAFGKELLGQLDGITDRRLHEEAIGALSQTEDPELAKTLLARLLDPKHDLVQEQALMFGLPHVGMFDVVEQFIYDHYEEIAPRMAELTRAYAMFPLIRSCDASKRDTVAAWAKQHITPQPGGERTVAQALEGMDLCITQKAAQAPAINAWFAKHGK
jgi:alanyl aminopeptidase